MKLTDLINKPLPDNEGYRLTDVQKVIRENNTYLLVLTFQRLKNAREAYESSNFKTLGTFHTGETILRIGNIAYARLFVIGSIWWNDGRPLAITPNYLKQYSLDSSIMGKNTPIRAKTSYFVEEQSMGMQYIDKQHKSVTRYSSIICYELDSPLFHQKKQENVVPLLSDIPPWENPAKTTFIAFHSHEIYRYFFTSTGITDLNGRMLQLQFNSKFPTENLLFDPIESIEKNGKHFVHLRKAYDLQDTAVLGNIAYYNGFKAIIRKMQNYLNTFSSFDFGFIEQLPVSKFSSMQVTAVRVRRKSDGATGLFIIQIHSCKGYIEHNYTPVVPLAGTNDEQKTAVATGGRRGSKGPTRGTEPKVNHNLTTGMGTATADLYLFGLEHLLTPDQDLILDEALYKRVHDDGSVFLFPAGPGGEIISPPGSHPDNNGPRPKNIIDVERTNYFEFFPEIVEHICNKVKEKHLTVDHFYLGDDLLYYPNPVIIDAPKIKTLALGDDFPKWQIYVAQIMVSGPNSTVRYYYLFEKYAETHTSSRTWLYAQKNFEFFTEESFLKSLKEFLFEQKNSDNKRNEPDNKFNHLQSKKIAVEHEKENTYVSVEKDEALHKHIEKISGRILRVYGVGSKEK